MLKNRSYKQRTFYLFASGFLVFILAYWIAISKTVETKQNLVEIEKKLRLIETAPDSIDKLEKRLVLVNDKIGDNRGDPTDFQKNLLDRISRYCAENSLVLKEFPQIHSIQKREYMVITGYASVEGPFIPLLKLLYSLETSRSYGKILSVNFTSQSDRMSKKVRLSMSIYIQTIKQTGNGNS